jgi:membrane-associated protease RseP (regulator of RpoE activity)
LNKFIERIARARPKAWRVVWNIGVVTAPGLMILAFEVLTRNLSLLIIKPQQAGPIQPIIPIPGVGVSFETFPYIVFALSILLVSHELSHGIASLVDHIPLKSTGLIFAHLVYGGFVEPDEEKLNAAPAISKLRVFAAGSYANIVLGVLFLFLLANFATTTAVLYTHSGVSITSLSPTLPAYSSGLQTGDTITSINGTSITSVNDLRNYMQQVAPGEKLAIGTRRGTFSITTAADPNNSTHALIGIGISDAYTPKAPFLSPAYPQTTGEAEFWLANVLISVAFINMLPLPILDGGHYLDVILELLHVKRIKEVRVAVYAISLTLLLLNFLISYIRFGYVRF